MVPKNQSLDQPEGLNWQPVIQYLYSHCGSWLQYVCCVFASYEYCESIRRNSQDSPQMSRRFAGRRSALCWYAERMYFSFMFLPRLCTARMIYNHFSDLWVHLGFIITMDLCTRQRSPSVNVNERLPEQVALLLCPQNPQSETHVLLPQLGGTDDGITV